MRESLRRTAVTQCVMLLSGITLILIAVLLVDTPQLEAISLVLAACGCVCLRLALPPQ